ncbi:helix-turn-helix domain-containing protein [Streptomyces sp. NPDC057381]|uniref:helix-turn-helix domain-containing protein n=1 Tax=unclassified Streptomyces TaxID=2593676 RepID=UPI00364373C4
MECAPAPGENIAVLRKARGLGQAKLARLAGISVSYLTKIENGIRPTTPPLAAVVAKHCTFRSSASTDSRSWAPLNRPTFSTTSGVRYAGTPSPRKTCPTRPHWRPTWTRP